MSIPLDRDPFALYHDWSQVAASDKRIAEPTAIALATSDSAGMPSVRMVLLKEVSVGGFVFYTNLNSAKAADLKANPQAAFCQHWMPLERQIRVQGRVEAVSDGEADAYFNSRDRMSRIGAWASHQSSVMPDAWALEKNVAKETARFAVEPLVRPPHWSGFRIVPSVIEFWIAKPFRLHDRVRFQRTAENGWQAERLFP
ncbi:MAG: pyridoxamine 5'-phosphate oxidase [Leptospiraceae bacterium]|nr:pyridoxamine 5'-phosphate oxidase [Leptospiraceae bacterium]